MSLLKYTKVEIHKFRAIPYIEIGCISSYLLWYGSWRHPSDIWLSCSKIRSPGKVFDLEPYIWVVDVRESRNI